ncbi:MAG: hypothetical protein IAX21_00475 [Candidatus Bathyarchaeota archaeon]|nr:MAG: hypothetical protein IAX21_00475 [Candidatus Bathyarchaeota archaeon]
MTIFGIVLLIIGTSMFSYSIKIIEEQHVDLIFPLTSVFISLGGEILTSKTILPAIQNKKTNKGIKRKPLEGA